MAAASVRMLMTASAVLASSAGVAPAFAPASVTALSLSAERFHTVTVCPTSMSRCAIAAPILPIPAIPICIERTPLSSLLHPVLDLVERGARAVIIEIAAGSAADADAADRLAGGHDGHATGGEGDVGQVAERGCRAGALAQPFEDRLGRIFLAHGCQRGRGVGLGIGAVERVNRRAVAPQRRLPHAIDIDHDARPRLA